MAGFGSIGVEPSASVFIKYDKHTSTDARKLRDGGHFVATFSFSYARDELC
jgi:hypothetical protein